MIYFCISEIFKTSIIDRVLDHIITFWICGCEFKKVITGIKSYVQNTFVYQKALIRTCSIFFSTELPLWFNNTRTQIQKMIFIQKLLLQALFKDFLYTKINLSLRYLFYHFWCGFELHIVILWGHLISLRGNQRKCVVYQC